MSDEQAVEKTVGDELVAEIAETIAEGQRERMKEFLSAEMAELKELHRYKAKLVKALTKGEEKLAKLKAMTLDEFDDHIRESQEVDDKTPVRRTSRFTRKTL
jgi:hypothetical protein